MIQAQTAQEAWQEILKFILENGNRYTDSRKRKCIEVENLTVSIHNPHHQTTLPIEQIGQMGDWIYPSPQEISDITLAKHKSHIYGYVHGSRLFAFGEGTSTEGVNQIQDFIIPLLQKDPASRRAVAVLVDPHKDSFAEVSDIPCVNVIQFRIRDNKLNMNMTIRSNDMFIGWPANVLQACILQEFVSSRLNVANGTITIHSLSAHVFEDQMEYIQKIIE